MPIPHRATPLLLALAACADSTVLPPPSVRVVEFVTTDASGIPGWLLDAPLEAEVRLADGTAGADVWVHWSTDAEGGYFSAESTQADAEGIARVEFSPGWALGAQEVTATVGNLSNALTVQATGMAFTAVESSDHRVCGLDADGRLWCWPLYDISGEWADTEPKRLDPATRPIRLETPLRFSRLRSQTVWSDGPPAMCAVTVDGELWCATRTDFTGPKGVPVLPTLHRVQTPVAVSDVAMGDLRGGSHNECFLDTGGLAWCRGLNDEGQLGDGTKTDSEEWRQVQGGWRFSQILVGFRYACGLALDLRPICWGYRRWTDEEFSVPTPVEWDLRLSHLVQGGAGVCGIDAVDHRMLCWGTTGPMIRPVDPSVPSPLQQLPTTATSIAGDDGGGRFLSAGRLHRFGYENGNIIDYVFLTGDIEPHATRLEQLLSRTSYYWCARHAAGATLCSHHHDRPVAVPMPGL
jgi:hypothetical protein